MWARKWDATIKCVLQQSYVCFQWHLLTNSALSGSRDMIYFESCWSTHVHKSLKRTLGVFFWRGREREVESEMGRVILWRSGGMMENRSVECLQQRWNYVFGTVSRKESIFWCLVTTTIYSSCKSLMLFMFLQVFNPFMI